MHVEYILDDSLIGLIDPPCLTNMLCEIPVLQRYHNFGSTVFQTGPRYGRGARSGIFWTVYAWFLESFYTLFTVL